MHRIIERLAHGMAILGGVVLTLLIAMTCASVVGREIGLGPINGDFEIVEAGVAFAIFAFLPLCQLTSGHAAVDIFTSRLSGRVNRAMRMVTDIVFAAVLILIAVQLFGGMMAKLRFGENTFILQFPVWWGYAASLCAAVVGAVVGVYVAVVRVFECASGKDLGL